jgi:hypothetical protein
VPALSLDFSSHIPAISKPCHFVPFFATVKPREPRNVQPYAAAAYKEKKAAANRIQNFSLFGLDNGGGSSHCHFGFGGADFEADVDSPHLVDVENDVIRGKDTKPGTEAVNRYVPCFSPGIS